MIKKPKVDEMTAQVKQERTAPSGHFIIN